MANKYLDLTGLQDFATKLNTKLHTIFATKADVGAPLVASTVAGMTDHDRIYVYTGSETGYTNGNWYYWDGTAWTSGGTYNSQAIGDGTITTAKLASGAVTAEKIADGAVVNSVNGETGAVTGVAVDDGYYENMTVGNAEQLLSNVYVDDSVPYTFRTSGGSADIGDRAFEDAVVGGTVAWNQLANTSTSGWTTEAVTLAVSSNVFTITSTSSTTQPKQAKLKDTLVNHVYLLSAYAKSDGTATLARLALFDSVGTYKGGINTDGTTYEYQASIVKKTNASDYIALRMRNADPTGGVASFDRPMIIDLTQMFGSAIADYIYSLEQSSTGSGVAWFKALGFNKPYYAYNAGTLIHVNASSHNTIGYNQWDEQWEAGGIDNDTGENNTSTYRIRSKNYIPVVPNQTYYIKSTLEGGRIFLIFYDANKGFVSSTRPTYYNNTTITIPSNAYYMRFYMWKDNWSDFANHGDICINLSWDGERNGEFEPFERHDYALDSSLTLRGIAKLNSSNELYFDGDEYANDGTVTRRYGVVTLDGTESGWAWTSFVASETTVHQASLTLPSTAKYDANIVSFVCDKLMPCSNNTRPANAGNYASLVGSGASVAFSAPNCDTLAKFITWIGNNHLTFVYELATPSVESAEPYTSPQWISDWGTEEYVVTEQNGVAMPVGHKSRYTANLRAKIEMAPDSPNGNGDYIVRQTNGVNAYVPLTERIPNAPSENGNYVLKCTVSGSTVSYVWESAT